MRFSHLYGARVLLCPYPNTTHIHSLLTEGAEQEKKGLGIVHCIRSVWATVSYSLPTTRTAERGRNKDETPEVPHL